MLTYPKCDVTFLDAFSFLNDKFNPKRLLVCQELHQDGDPHLHCYLEFSQALRTTDCHIFDMFGKHGKYEGCRSVNGTIQYCTKDANTKLPNFKASWKIEEDPNFKKQFKTTRAEDFAPLVEGIETPEDLIQKKPQYFINYATLSKSYQLFHEAKAVPKNPLPLWLPNPWGKALPVLPSTKKRRHYHFWSSGPNAGKTTWATWLLDQYGGAINSNKEPYWNITDKASILVLDEYNSARFRYDELNAMADGTYSYRRFGLGCVQFSRSRSPIIIILSNCELSTLYPFMNELLYARYKSIDLSTFKF